MSKVFKSQMILKSLGAMKVEGSKQDSQNPPRSPMPEGEEL